MTTAGDHDDHYLTAPAGKPRFLWFRLVWVVALLCFIGWRFLYYCEPEPKTFQLTTFYFTLFAILLETIRAGWYRGRSPWERYLLVAAKWVIIVLGIIAALILVYLFLGALMVDLPQ